MKKIACVDDFQTYVDVVANVLRRHGENVDTYWGPGCVVRALSAQPDAVVAVVARRHGALGDPRIDDEPIDGLGVLGALLPRCDAARVPLLVVGFGVTRSDLPTGSSNVVFFRAPAELERLATHVREAVAP